MPSGSLTKILPEFKNDILYLIAAFCLGMFLSHIFLKSKIAKQCNCEGNRNSNCNCEDKKY
jgi:hypothetical protein